MAARDNYSKYSMATRFTGPKIVIPDFNYTDGERKSQIYDGSGWYVPSERKWEAFHEHQHLPNAARRDAKEMVREQDYVDLVTKRDRPRAPMLTSYVPSEVTEFKTNGHRPVNSEGSGCYGFYQEALDKHASGEFRTLPAISRYPGYPLVTKTTGI